MPGCADFGYKAFADCGLLQFHANGGGVKTFGSATKLGHYLFLDCISLTTATILQDGHDLNHVENLRRDASAPRSSMRQEPMPAITANCLAGWTYRTLTSKKSRSSHSCTKTPGHSTAITYTRYNTLGSFVLARPVCSEVETLAVCPASRFGTCFFCTSGGAVCAGCAQVTLVE